MRRLIALALLAAAPAAAQQAAPETVTIDAFSVWEATGTTTLVGPDTQMFAGEMSGPYFIDAGEGPVPAGTIVCVGSLEASSQTGAQKGSARCRLVAVDGAVAFGRFSCEGWRIVGCVGRFVIDGGEGRLSGVAGEGPIAIRRYETALIATENGAVVEHALGVASWKGFALSGAASR
jgi:hypothetical protein